MGILFSQTGRATVLLNVTVVLVDLLVAFCANENVTVYTVYVFCI